MRRASAAARRCPRADRPPDPSSTGPRPGRAPRGPARRRLPGRRASAWIAAARAAGCASLSSSGGRAPISAASPVARAHHRRAAGHGLEQGQRPGLVVGRVDEAGGALQLVAHAGPVQEAREPDACGDAQCGRMTVQRRLQRPFARQRELRPRSLAQPGEGVEQPEQALAIAEPADIEHARPAIWAADPAGRTGCRRRSAPPPAAGRAGGRRSPSSWRTAFETATTAMARSRYHCS